MKKHIHLVIILTLIFSSCLKAQSQYPAGSVFGPSGPTAIVDVTNPKTGRTWMDRNLGATRAGSRSTDVESYGDLYQQGRLDLDRFVSETIGIGDVEEAFHKMERGEVLRSVVVMDA